MESPDEGKRLSPISSSPASSDFLEAATIVSPENTARPTKHNENNIAIGIGTLDQTLPVAEHRNGTSSNDVGTSPATSSLPEYTSKPNASTNGKDLRTDPAASSTLGDQANVSTTEDKSNRSASDCSEATGFESGASGNSTPQASEQPCQAPAVDAQSGELNLGNGSAATQSPPTQVMERPGDPSSSPYRIPDYVFARNKSTAPLEWSTASNESLFSIQMGNMSFTRDQFAWLSKSGELGLPGEVNYLPSSPCNIDFNSNQPPSKQTAAPEVPQKRVNVEEQPSPRKTEAKAAEIMREVIRENSENNEKSYSQPVPGSKYHSACLSHASDGSTRSFAFPILAGEGDVSSSRRGDFAKQKHHSPSKPLSQRGSRPQTHNETPNASQPPKSTTSNLPKCSWGLSCFSCCPSCCS